MDSYLRDLITQRPYAESLLTSAVLTLIVVWSLVWKGIALWYSSQSRQKYWFVAILILNTVGILEIAYLFFFSSKKLEISKILAHLKSLNLPKLGKK